MFKKVALWGILIMIAISALLLPFAGIEQSKRSNIDRAILFPSQFQQCDWSADDLTFDNVYFRATDGTPLQGWYLPSHQRKLRERNRSTDGLFFS